MIQSETRSFVIGCAQVNQADSTCRHSLGKSSAYLHRTHKHLFLPQQQLHAQPCYLLACVGTPPSLPSEAKPLETHWSHHWVVKHAGSQPQCNLEERWKPMAQVDSSTSLQKKRKGNEGPRQIWKNTYLKVDGRVQLSQQPRR